MTTRLAHDPRGRHVMVVQKLDREAFVVRLDPKLLAMVTEIADHRGLSRNEWITRWIERGAAEERRGSQ